MEKKASASKGGNNMKVLLVGGTHDGVRMEIDDVRRSIELLHGVELHINEAISFSSLTMSSRKEAYIPDPGSTEF